MNNTNQAIDSIRQQILQETDRLILVLVVAEDCHEKQTDLEIQIFELLEKNKPNIKFLRVCFKEETMPWPRPMTQCLYYFAPGKFKSLFLRSGLEIISRFEEDLKIATKMMKGQSYDQSSFDEESLLLIKKTEEMFDSEKDNELPPTSQMLRNFAKDMWKTAKSVGKRLPVLVPAEVAAERYTICTACPKLTEKFRCTECGCFMKKKTQLAQSSCPIGKWAEFNKE